MAVLDALGLCAWEWPGPGVTKGLGPCLRPAMQVWGKSALASDGLPACQVANRANHLKNVGAKVSLRLSLDGSRGRALVSITRSEAHGPGGRRRSVEAVPEPGNARTMESLTGGLRGVQARTSARNSGLPPGRCTPELAETNWSGEDVTDPGALGYPSPRSLT